MDFVIFLNNFNLRIKVVWIDAKGDISLQI